MAKWTVWIEARQPDGRTERIKIAVIERDLSSLGQDDLGLRLAEAKDLLRDLQSHLSHDQVRQLGAAEPNSSSCGRRI